ncbi:MAG: polysaccharide biosynthesis protein, partial [Planctomycetota bacterium]
MSASTSKSRFEQFIAWVRGHRFALALISHVFLFSLCWFMAFGLAYNFKRFGDWFQPFFLLGLPFVLAIKLAVFFSMGLHRGSWRYVSMRDAAQITKASWWSFFWIFCLYYLTVNLDALLGLVGVRGFEFDPFGHRDFPDSVLLLDFVGTVVLVCAARVAVRLHYEQIQPIQEGNAPKLLIVGAGNAGENVVREILRQPVLEYRVVGFLDDDPNKWGALIHTKEVLGPTDKIKSICESYAVDEILIAMPSATRAQVRRVIELCQGANLRFKTLPAMADIITGRAKVQEIRDVNINDLLGRPPVELDSDLIASYLRDRVVLVTGAGGSIGSEMCRQIAPFTPRRLVLLEQAEQNLFEIERELRGAFGELDIVPY